MDSILNITNGGSAINIMQQAGVAGEIISWDDVLHAGPVLPDLNLQQLSEQRAQYIAGLGWAELDEVRQKFQQRDQTLQRFDQYQQVILWFEHDLYDQLQILQILDWFANQDLADNQLMMICTDQYLGPMQPEEMQALIGSEQAVTNEQLKFAQAAWAAFRQEQPQQWLAFLEPSKQKQSDTILPFLSAAIKRLLQEYPSSFNGLSRTAQQTLQLLSEKSMPAGKLFGSYIETEERRFLGDSSFWLMLREMLTAKPSVIKLSEGDSLELPSKPKQILSLTETGHSLLTGSLNWLDIYPYDYWFGGVHLNHKQPQKTWLIDNDFNMTLRPNSRTA